MTTKNKTDKNVAIESPIKLSHQARDFVQRYSREQRSTVTATVIRIQSALQDNADLNGIDVGAAVNVVLEAMASLAVSEKIGPTAAFELGIRKLDETGGFSVVFTGHFRSADGAIPGSSGGSAIKEPCADSVGDCWSECRNGKLMTCCISDSVTCAIVCQQNGDADCGSGSDVVSHDLGG